MFSPELVNSARTYAKIAAGDRVIIIQNCKPSKKETNEEWTHRQVLDATIICWAETLPGVNARLTSSPEFTAFFALGIIIPYDEEMYKFLHSIDNPWHVMATISIAIQTRTLLNSSNSSSMAESA